MINPAYGDLAQNYLLKRHDTALKTGIARLTQELTGGTRQDIGAAVRGDYRTLAGIERTITQLTAMNTAASEAALRASATQSVLGTLKDLASGNAVTLMTAVSSANPAMIDAATSDSRERLFSAVSALNTDIAGRHLLSGTRSDVPPLTSGEAILTALQGAVAGAATVSDALSAIDDWFDAPQGGGGFLDQAYRGSDTAVGYAPVLQTGMNDGLTAADPAIRAALRGLAVAALVSEGLFSGDAAARASLAQAAGERLIASSDGLTALQGKTGAAEAAIAALSTRNAAEISGLELARAGIVAADPYETATELEAAQTRLETLYTITARLSRLSFADYMS